MGPRLRELAPTARGNQDERSRNLGPLFFTVPVRISWKVSVVQRFPPFIKVAAVAARRAAGYCHFARPSSVVSFSVSRSARRPLPLPPSLPPLSSAPRSVRPNAEGNDGRRTEGRRELERGRGGKRARSIIALRRNSDDEYHRRSWTDSSLRS